MFKSIYFKIIISVCMLGVTIGLVINSIYLSNKIEKYKKELDKIVLSESTVLTQSDTTNYKKNLELDGNSENLENDKITEEYINKLIEEYYSQQVNAEKYYKLSLNPIQKNINYNNYQTFNDNINQYTIVNKSETTNEVLKCNHNFESKVNIKTCPENTTIDYWCNNCGYRFSILQEVKKHNLVIVSDTTTCNDNGIIIKKCTGCDYTEVYGMPHYSHQYEVISDTSTCSSTGIITQKCKLCGDIFEKEVTASNHNFVSGKCTKCGMTIENTSRVNVTCPTIIKEDENFSLKFEITEDVYGIQADIDIYGNNTKITTQKFSHVRYDLDPNYKAEFVKSPFWNWSIGENTIVVSNIVLIDKNGKILESGKSITVKVNVIETRPFPPSHTHKYYMNSETQPTCTEKGIIVYVCAACGETKTEELPAIGHTFIGETCIRCGAKDPNYILPPDNPVTPPQNNVDKPTPPHTHNYVEISKIPATCTTSGEITKACNCGDKKIEHIPAMGHSYNGETCIRCGNKNPDYKLPNEEDITPPYTNSTNKPVNTLQNIIDNKIIYN